MYSSCYRVVYLSCSAGRTDGTVNIMSCETLAQESADLPSISFKLNSLNKEQLINKVQKALQVCSVANTIINKQNDIIMKYMEKMLETGNS